MQYTLLKESEPVARKTYYCDWCGEEIPVKTKYSYSVFTYDGLGTNKMHLECNKALYDSDIPEDGEWELRSQQRGIPIYED